MERYLTMVNLWNRTSAVTVKHIVTSKPGQVIYEKDRILHPLLYKSSEIARRLPVPVAARSKAYVCGLSLAGVAGSNPAGELDVFFMNVVR